MKTSSRAASRAERAADAPTPKIEVIVFAVGEDLFALPLEAVREAVSLRGLGSQLREIEVGGRPVPVFRSAPLLGLARAGAALKTRGLVLAEGGREMAIAVEEVLGVRRLEVGSLTPAPPRYAGPAREVIRGIGTMDGQMVVVLDPAVLVRIAEERREE